MKIPFSRKGTSELILVFLLAFMAVVIAARAEQSGPNHYDLNGEADSYGSQFFLLFVPITGLIIWLCLKLLKRVKNSLNYPVRLTAMNREKQEKLMLQFIDTYGMIILFSFNVISLFVVLSLRTTHLNGGIPLLLPLFLLVVLIAPLLIYLMKARKIR